MITSRLKIKEDLDSAMPRIDVPKIADHLRTMRYSESAPLNGIDNISVLVCSALGLTLDEVKQRHRGNIIPIARQACMAVLRAISLDEKIYAPKYSFKEIGDSFGRDHSTVLSACRKFYTNYSHDVYIKKNLDAIIENSDNRYLLEIVHKIKAGHYENVIAKRNKKR